jgi:hypothetical protein
MSTDQTLPKPSAMDGRSGVAPQQEDLAAESLPKTSNIPANVAI